MRFESMAISIGKRKRAQREDDSGDGSDAESALRALFQKAFEAKFKPLPITETQHHVDDHSEADEISEDSAESDEWDGLSDEGEPVEVINLNPASDKSQLDLAQERRSFMVSKPAGPFETYAEKSCSRQSRHL